MVSVQRFVQLVLLLVVVTVSTVTSQEGTVRPVDSNSSTVGETPAPTAYVPPEVPVPTEDSATFRKVPSVVCSQEVSDMIAGIYSKNRELFDVCAEKSKYQIFPFSGNLPTSEQIYGMATTKACTALFTACVLANLPECDISGLGLKGATESLLKITVDVDEGKPAPDTLRFHLEHTWRRDVNLAQAAGVPFGNDSQLYSEYTKNLWKALTKYNVRVQADLSIVYNLTDLTSAVNGTKLESKPSAMQLANAGQVKNSSSSSAASESAETATSLAVRTSTMGRFVVALVAIAVAIVAMS